MSSGRGGTEPDLSGGAARPANSLPGDLADRVLEFLSAAVCVCDANGVIIRYNRHAAALWGQAPRIGDPDRKFCESLRLFRPGGGPLTYGETAVAQVLQTGTPVRDRNVVIARPDGSRIFALVNVDPLRDAGGSLVGAVSYFTDITERKRIERDLRSREVELRLVTDSVPALIGYVDSDRRYRFVNRSYESWFGRPRGDMEGRHMVEVLGEAVYEMVRPHVDSALAGHPVHFEAHVPHRDRAEHDVEGDYLPRRGPEGEVLGFYIFIHDVTERKRTAEALRAHAFELETVMETVPAAVWLTHDRDASHIVGSRYAARLFRVPPGENLSRTPRDTPRPTHWRFCRHGVDIPLSESPLRRAARGELIVGDELELAFDDGTSLPLLINAAPIFDADGGPIGSVAAAMDITERKRAEERQQLIMAELDHRVRNTLGTIRSMLRLTGKATATKEELAAAVSGRIDALARAHGLLTRTGWRGASLRSLVSDELAPYDAPGGQRIGLDGPDLSLGPSAAVSLALVLHELATNAAKYGALSVARGQVLVSWQIVEGEDEPRLQLRWAESGGPTVAPPRHEGFGSAMLRGALVHEFGAEVRVDFAPSGVCFLASAPLSRLTARGGGSGDISEDRSVIPAMGTLAPARCDPAGARILVVEDEILIALDLQDRLETMGVEIVGPAGRLEDAFALAESRGPDAALLDVNVGGGRVFPIADLMAQRGIPFAFLTGYETRLVLPERFHGAPVLQKPFSESAVIDVVRRLVGKARAGDRAISSAAG